MRGERGGPASLLGPGHHPTRTLWRWEQSTLGNADLQAEGVKSKDMQLESCFPPEIATVRVIRKLGFKHKRLY